MPNRQRGRPRLNHPFKRRTIALYGEEWQAIEDSATTHTMTLVGFLRFCIATTARLTKLAKHNHTTVDNLIDQIEKGKK